MNGRIDELSTVIERYGESRKRDRGVEREGESETQRGGGRERVRQRVRQNHKRVGKVRVIYIKVEGDAGGRKESINSLDSRTCLKL